MLEHAVAGQVMSRGCNVLDVIHGMTGMPGDEEHRA
jgi:hypothetical protein